MGQAKRRGTHEERVKQARDRDAIARQKANEEYWKRREEEALRPKPVKRPLSAVPVLFGTMAGAMSIPR